MDHRASEAPEGQSGHPGTDDAAPVQWLKMRMPPDQVRYFQACARIRGISFSALMRRILDAVHKDQMVQAILDDDGKRAARRKGEHPSRRRS